MNRENEPLNGYKENTADFRREFPDRVADGFLLLDFAGRVKAFDERFAALLSGAAPGPDIPAAIGSLFPPDLYPGELQRLAARRAVCELHLGPEQTRRARLVGEPVGTDTLIGIQFLPRLSVRLLFDMLDKNMAERRTLSRCLHDTIAQNLVLLSLSLSRLETDLLHPPGPTFARVAGLVDHCSRDVRVLSYILSMPSLKDMPPETALDWLFSHLRDDARLDAGFLWMHEAGVPLEVGPRVRSLLLAIVQLWSEHSVGKQKPVSTRFTLTRQANHLLLEMTSSEPDDSALNAPLESTLLRECIQGLPGRITRPWAASGTTIELLIDPMGETEDSD
jgi:hypothetical protein